MGFKKILVVGESGPNGLRPESLEAVTAAHELAHASGAELAGAVIGAEADGAAQTMAATGLSTVYLSNDARLTTDLPITKALAIVVETSGADVVILAGTTTGRDVAARLGARLNAAVASDVVGLDTDGTDVIAQRSVLGGKAQVAVTLKGDPARIISLRPGSWAKAPDDQGAGAVVPVAVELNDNDTRVRVEGFETSGETGGVKLQDADTIVAGGRGLKEAQNFEIIERLAEALGGAVAASRAVVDAGWRPHHEQIGQTGQSVTPRLYIAIGISGAVQHNVGMQGSEYIVAINRDPDAPIFKLASFGIVGDLFDVIPALTAELAS
ncbi:MAG: electron transfer flavoprotein subunit alpha/FixB family protein [Thermomicrobiales bacterium]|nr:electron transfer flavoprotein subunit alpha/FixB family protein [Thermomicrobiales bacterium]MCO5221610.1 electron transfer flavoprotein subunit alpha/FixB family protein [Thermomicrobiales bacterium]